ncbi:hypothetical protein CU103_19545 [Phyllobacterium sophorae]|uniref:Uncharacterized protein n=1 Tax=Phyllobacterium sophorae TaxID=1520277 RepID=A0A2P7B6G7_9HYPH|nr:hypothetical protein CU103_19545 [Phyllobacterium sophorae]
MYVEDLLTQQSGLAFALARILTATTETLVDLATSTFCTAAKVAICSFTQRAAHLATITPMEL